ncbi:hypothetical protein GGF39_004088 [Coemansia sp. RSA 1721]|nr:hypothetical protein GGF39_004088 [Coemansia sp. RSA 1721]
MPKKFGGENSKVAAAKEKKAAAQAEKDAKKRSEKEAQEAVEWSKGAKKGGKKEDQEAKRLEKLAKKKEAEKALQEEDKDISKSTKGKTGPPKLTPAQNKRPVPVLRGTDKKVAAKEAAVAQAENANRPVEQYQARNVDDIIDVLENINDDAPNVAIDGSSAKKGGIAATVDRHPERRAKAAYKAFEDRVFERVKKENPGLRLSQIKEVIWKEWQKSPDNPFNQVLIQHNSSKEQIDAVVESQRKKIQDRLRVE